MRGNLASAAAAAASPGPGGGVVCNSEGRNLGGPVRNSSPRFNVPVLYPIPAFETKSQVSTKMYASYTQVRRKDAGRGVVLKTEVKKMFEQKGKSQK